MKNIAQKIKEQVSQNHSLADQLGLAISCYDQNNKILISKTIVETNKTLESVINIIYKSFLEKIEKNIVSIQCHIVKGKENITNIQDWNNDGNHGLLAIDTETDKSSLRIPTQTSPQKKEEIIDILLQKHNMEKYEQLYSVNLTPIYISI